MKLNSGNHNISTGTTI